MARIKNTNAYVFDTVPEVSSFLVGSDQGDGRITKSYRIDTLFGLAQTEGFIKEAPLDGQPYVRQNGDWELVPASGVGSVFSVFGRTGAVSALEADYASFYANIIHTHTESDITDLQDYLLPTDIGSTVQAWSADLDLVSGTNTGDQDSIVGITGTKVQFDAALTDGNFIFVGDAPTAHTHVEADITDLQDYLLDAPVDGSLYGRLDGAWAVVPSSVTSIFGRTGAVVAEEADYAAFYANIIHTHVKADITDFNVDISDLNTAGTPSISNFLRGDGTWATVLGGVSSVFGRTAAVTALEGDYAAFYANIIHTHVEADITDLQSYLLAADIDTLAELNTIVTDATLITDAPSDGSEYVRLDGNWSVVSNTGGGTWGSITGTLSDQLDLQNQLNQRINTTAANQSKLGNITVQRSDINSVHLEVKNDNSTSTTSDSRLILESSGNNFALINWAQATPDADVTEFRSTAGGSSFKFVVSNNLQLTLGSNGTSTFEGNVIGGNNITASNQLIALAVRATGTGDASLSSTAHGFQVGPTAGANVIMDGNELMARNGGNGGTLELQRDGGTINFGANPDGTSTFIVADDSKLNIAPNASLVIQDNADLFIGTGQGELRIWSNGSNTFFDTRADRDIFFRDVTTTRFTFDISNGNLTAANFILSSDERMKKNIRDLESKPIDVNWKQFQMIDGEGEERYGVIAQELEKVHPEFVRTDEEGMKSVAYTDLLIAKVAEQENRIELLESKLELLIKELL